MLPFERAVHTINYLKEISQSVSLWKYSILQYLYALSITKRNMLLIKVIAFCLSCSQRHLKQNSILSSLLVIFL